MHWSNDAFAAKLRMRRADIRMSQCDVAKAAGITQQTYSFYENGKAAPVIANFHSLCVALDVSPSDAIMWGVANGEEQ